METRSRLDLFLMKAGALVLVYYCLRLIIKFTPLFRPIFVGSRDFLINLLTKATHIFLKVLGYDSNLYETNIVYITGSDGVKIVNACIGWAIMAIFIGFILIYPGIRKAKYWFVPAGLVFVNFINILRISGMALISFHNPDSLDFYHRYVFNFALYLAIFLLWFIWIAKYGIKNKAED